MVTHVGAVALIGAAVLVTTGCSDACDEAADKAEECGILPTSVEDDEVDVDCEDAVECSAECVNQATCAELQDRDNPETALYKCLVGCDQATAQ